MPFMSPPFQVKPLSPLSRRVADMHCLQDLDMVGEKM